MIRSQMPASSTVVDSILFRDAFGTAKMRAVFSDTALIQRYIDVEVALAKAEARCGVIPLDAAEVIARESQIERIDFDHMREETDIVGYPETAHSDQSAKDAIVPRWLTALARIVTTLPSCCRSLTRSHPFAAYVADRFASPRSSTQIAATTPSRIVSGFVRAVSNR